MKLSIVMPNFNKEPWLADAIRSVMDQNYKDWELIIVDDGSRDGSLDVIKHFASVDKRISYLILRKNMGIAIARNEGTAVATGDVIVVHDSDDIMLQGKLKTIARYFKKPDCDVFYSNYYHGDVAAQPRKRVDLTGIEPYDLLYPKQRIGHFTIAYRKKAWDKHKYNPAYKINDDYPFLISLWNAGLKFKHCKDYLCIMRLLPNGASYVNRKKTAKEVEKLSKTIKKRHG